MCLPVCECMNLVKRCRIQSCWMFQIPPDVQALFDDPCCTELNSEVCIALFLANGRIWRDGGLQRCRFCTFVSSKDQFILENENTMELLSAMISLHGNRKIKCWEVFGVLFFQFILRGH